MTTMERVILTFGMRKSASTYVFQITRDLFANCSSSYATEDSYPEVIQHPFVPDADYLNRVLSVTQQGKVSVRKTHLALNDEIRQAIETGDCFPVFQIRDPLDIVASLIDAGEAERQKPAELQREGFTAIREFEDTLPIVRKDIAIAREWIEFGIEHGFPCIDFEFVTSRPVGYLKLIAGRFGLAGDFEAIVRTYSREPSQIMEFNRGEKGRGDRFRAEAEGRGIGQVIEAFRCFLRSVAENENCRFGGWISR